MIVSIDPGLTTGLFYVSPIYGEPHKGLELPFNQVCDWFENNPNLTAIITEKYMITGDTLKKTRQYDALHINGVLRYFAYTDEIPYIEQTPADAKRLATDDRLKAQGWWTPGKGHANDAARHMYLYYVKQGWIIP